MARLRVIIQTLFLLSWLFATSAFELTGSVVWNDVCPNAVALGQAQVILDNGRLSGGVTADGSFTISNVPLGSYLISVISHDFLFDQLRVDVTNETAHVHPYARGTPFNPPSTVSLPYPLKLIPREKLDFYVPPQSFDLYSLLTNPMVLFGIGGLAVFAFNSLVDVQALQEAAKNAEGRPNPPPRIADAHDQTRGVAARRGAKKVRR